MNGWVLGIGALYLGALVYAALRARVSNRSDDDFLTAGSNLGSLIGCLTVAATLFSTFTLMGMPDLFRNHGVGAWFFLGVADCALAFVALWFGVNIRRRMVGRNFNGFSGWLSEQYNSRRAAYVYLLGIFVFLVPYVAIQIKGVSLFLTSIMPGVMPSWAWSVAIVSVILIYSEIGGLKAIIFADSIQGLMLFGATLIIAVGCISHFGGVGAMFDSIESSSPALLSLPGPAGLFTYQFLIASFLAIVMIPVTQPQMSIRLVIMRDTPSLARMAVLLGLFSFALILATLPIGFYGAALYADDTTARLRREGAGARPSSCRRRRRHRRPDRRRDINGGLSIVRAWQRVTLRCLFRSFSIAVGGPGRGRCFCAGGAGGVTGQQHAHCLAGANKFRRNLSTGADDPRRGILSSAFASPDTAGGRAGPGCFPDIYIRIGG